MPVSLTYEDKLGDMRRDFERLGKNTEKLEAKTVLKACKIVAGEVQQRIPRSLKDKSGYVHMKDDVKISGTKKDRDGAIIRTIGGSKKTGTKWHLLEHGTYGGQGATHFMEKSLDATEAEVDKIFEEGIRSLMDELG